MSCWGPPFTSHTVGLSVCFLCLFYTTLLHSSFLNHPFHCVTPLLENLGCIFLLVKGTTFGSFSKAPVPLSWKQTPVPPLPLRGNCFLFCFLLLSCRCSCTFVPFSHKGSGHSAAFRTFAWFLPIAERPLVSVGCSVSCLLCTRVFQRTYWSKAAGMLWCSLRIRPSAFGNRPLGVELLTP